jgi:cyclin B
MTVNLIDRYLQSNQIARSKLQLIGVSAMFIACKFEEIYAPELKDFVYVCDNAYTKEQILECEGSIIRTVDFNLTHTSSLRFLERYSALSGADE